MSNHDHLCGICSETIIKVTLLVLESEGSFNNIKKPFWGVLPSENSAPDYVFPAWVNWERTSGAYNDSKTFSRSYITRRLLCDHNFFSFCSQFNFFPRSRDGPLDLIGNERAEFAYKSGLQPADFGRPWHSHYTNQVPGPAPKIYDVINYKYEL